jgi:branched-chain amino acid transport system substrate-binding protein
MKHKVPQLGINSGASAWNDAAHYPYSMSGIASHELDGRMVGEYVMRHVSDAKIAVLYQNDDFGRDHLAGLKKELGDKAASLLVGCDRQL